MFSNRPCALNALRTSSRATHQDSISSDYGSPASCRNRDRAGAGGAAIDGCVASDFDGEVRQQKPSLVDWLNVNLETMRMAWTRCHCHLRSLMDYHTIFEYSRYHVPLRREWVALWNDAELRVADVDYYDSDAGGSTADGLDGVSVLPKEAMYGNWLVLTCCDDDMTAIREIVSPKSEKEIEGRLGLCALITHFIIRVMS